MSYKQIADHFLEAQSILTQFIEDETNFKRIQAAGDIMIDSLFGGGKIMTCGNGGSMCDAMHFAEEMTGRFRLDKKPMAAMALGDASHITCVSNDYGYDHIFSRPVEGLGRDGDVLLAISTSGNSKNILNAIEAAKGNNMKVIGLTGKDGGAMADLCDVEIRAPKSKWSDRTQEIHIKVIHSMIDYIEQNIHPKNVNTSID